jgi:hypothetical protein
VRQNESSLSRRTRHLARVSDPAHDAIDQTYPHGRGGVIRGARRGELRIQLVGAETLAGTVWNFCNSYYRRESTKGKIFATFPGPVSLFWWLARRPRYSDYEVVGGERWQRAKRQGEGIWTGLKMIGIMSS